MISYEYPLNERIRTLLRLEDLFLKIAHFTAGVAPQDHHVALLTIFETLEVASRAQRLAAADDVIDNAGTISTLHAQVDRLHAAYLAAATH